MRLNGRASVFITYSCKRRLVASVFNVYFSQSRLVASVFIVHSFEGCSVALKCKTKRQFAKLSYVHYYSFFFLFFLPATDHGVVAEGSVGSGSGVIVCFFLSVFCFFPTV